MSQGGLVNHAHLHRRPTCTMWVKFLARANGGNVEVSGEPQPELWPELLVITDDTAQSPVPLPDLTGHIPSSPPVRYAPLTGQRFVRAAALSGAPRP